MRPVNRRQPSIAERLERSYVLEPTTGCWLWKARVNKAGYGGLRIDGKNRLAHRVSYELACGAIPAGFHVDHLCRVRFCVNPAHLEAVPAAENARRIRQRFVKGAYVPWAKVTPVVEQHARDVAYVHAGNSALYGRTVDERFFDLYREEPNTGCWLWIGEISDEGFARFYQGPEHPLAHRYAWETHRGPIADGHVVTHVCKEKSCVNPAHLRHVLRAVSNPSQGRWKKTTCKRGHSLVDEAAVYYTYWTLRGKAGMSRLCLECRRAQDARRVLTPERRQRMKEAHERWARRNRKQRVPRN